MTKKAHTLSSASVFSKAAINPSRTRVLKVFSFSGRFNISVAMRPCLQSCRV